MNTKGNNQQGMSQQNAGQQLMPNGMTVQQYKEMMQQRQQRMNAQNAQNGQMPQNNQMQQNMQMQQNRQMQLQQNRVNQGNNMFDDGFIPPENDYQVEFDFDAPEKKKGSKFKIVFIVIILLVVVAFVIRTINMKKNSASETMDNGSGIALDEEGNPILDEEGNPVYVDNTESSTMTLSGDAYENLQNALNDYNAELIDTCVGPEQADSYLAQEWAYVNEVQLKQEFIQKVCAGVKFSNIDSASGTLTASVPDYAAVTESILADKDYIAQLYESSKFDEKTDYTFDEDMFKLFCQWILDRGYANTDLPRKEVTIKMITTTGPQGRIIADDGELDNALFATDDLHKAMKEFSKICVKFDGIGYETYTEKREVKNPDYEAWQAVFEKYYIADGGRYNTVTGKYEGGKFNPKTSKWEPWYVRDENNNLVYDENGEKVVNYFSVKDENGNDWIQPAEYILDEVELEREIELPWEEERGIPYGIIGTYYIQHDYEGVYDTVFRLGDGSIERPAGFGTPIVTRMKGIDEQYHAVKVALTGYWVQQEAIDYVEAFSEKNRGFVVNGPVKLICFEFTVENLEDEAFAFNGTEICLCNRNANVSSRTGTLYGFYDKGILEPHKTVKLNDWYSSTELDQKYVAWGRDFGRQYPLVYFNCLAGTGDIPTYSAYTQFCGKPEITESAEEY